MEQLSVERQQLRMLVDAIKKIVTNPRTPNWIKNPLETAVKDAKSIKPYTSQAEAETAPETSKNEKEMLPPVELDVGVECVDALDPGDKCLYRVTRRGLAIDGVQLFDVQVSRGDKKTPVGTTMHNVPATYLRPVRRLQDS